jgi:hypothetical protein
MNTILLSDRRRAGPEHRRVVGYGDPAEEANQRPDEAETGNNEAGKRKRTSCLPIPAPSEGVRSLCARQRRAENEKGPRKFGGLSQAGDPGAERLAALLGVDEGKVRLYVPLLLPLGLELGGFIFLAFGLAPRRREEVIVAPATAAEPIAIADDSVATEIATPMQTIAIAAAKPPAAGTKAYYSQRLQREHPAIAVKIARG